jgi:hypothetical protein
MKANPFRFIRRTGASLVISLLLAGCANTALAQNRPAASRSNGGSGGQGGQAGSRVSVPVVSVARQGQAGGAGITGVTRTTRLSENNQTARDFFRSSGLRLP